MSFQEALGLLAFLAMFIIPGGAALGGFCRSLVRHDFQGLNLFFLVWGGGFAGIPLLIGATQFISGGRFAFFIATLFLFGMTILVVALTPADLFSNTAGDGYSPVVIGAFLAVIGTGIVAMSAPNGISTPLVVGLLLGAAGAIIVLRAAYKALRTIRAEPS